MKQYIINQVLKEAFHKKKAWFPGKEEVKYFEELAEKEQQIWPDAADSGILMNSDSDLAEARRNIKKILDIYKAKISKGPGKDTTTEFFVTFEQEGKWYLGETMKIYYHDGGKNKDKPNAPGYDPRFISVEVHRDRKTEIGYKEDKKASSQFFPF